MAYEYEGENIRKVRLYNVMTGSSKKTKPIKELEEVYAKAKAFDEIIPFVREQYVRANQNYGFAKYYGKSNEELKQAEEELLKIQKVAKEVCNVLGIKLEEFIILEEK
ncbi:hypothetical protein [Mammaliicoccus sciuri]|uniref:hypothetical protein n=1 Tax=Mammaliicoccus sciuri TaxID=1296 RepID=UPI0034DD9180